MLSHLYGTGSRSFQNDAPTPPVHTHVLKETMATDRTSLKLTDEKKRLFDQAEEIVAANPSDDPPRSDVIDAALTHLIESHENLEEVQTSTRRRR